MNIIVHGFAGVEFAAEYVSGSGDDIDSVRRAGEGRELDLLPSASQGRDRGFC